MVPAEAVGGSQTRRQRARRWRSSRMKAGQGHAGLLRRSTHLVESAVRGAAAAASGSGRAEAPAPAPARAAAARRLRRGRGRESATRVVRARLRRVATSQPFAHPSWRSARVRRASCSLFIMLGAASGRSRPPELALQSGGLVAMSTDLVTADLADGQTSSSHLGRKRRIVESTTRGAGPPLWCWPRAHGAPPAPPSTGSSTFALAH